MGDRWIGKGGGRHTDQEPRPYSRFPQRGEQRIKLPLSIPDSERKVRAHDREQRQTSDLPRQARNHDIHARITSLLIIGRRRNSTTRTLQSQRHEIRNHEGDGISPRLKPRKGFTIHDDDSS